VTTPLETLRDAAKNREWTTLQSNLSELFGVLGVYPSLEIVVTHLHDYLPTFQRYHPDDNILKELLVGVVAFGFAPDQLPEYIIENYDTPGSGQFAHAVFELCRAMQKDRPLDDRLGLMTSAVANGILAELAQYWYSRHLEEYARVRANRVDPETGEYTDPDAARIPVLFWMNPVIGAKDTKAWLKIADAVEKKLKE
jgi:hypothetical protein